MRSLWNSMDSLPKVNGLWILLRCKPGKPLNVLSGAPVVALYFSDDRKVYETPVWATDEWAYSEETVAEYCDGWLSTGEYNTP